MDATDGTVEAQYELVDPDFCGSEVIVDTTGEPLRDLHVKTTPGERKLNNDCYGDTSPIKSKEAEEEGLASDSEDPLPVKVELIPEDLVLDEYDDPAQFVKAEIKEEPPQNQLTGDRVKKRGKSVKKTRATCDICNKEFTLFGNFKAHMRTHTGERPYSCPTCGKNFAQIAILTRHQLLHSGIKPFRCDTCYKCFTNKYNLSVHYRVHTGEKPYSCSFCGKGFSRVAHVKGHERVHTSDKPYRCLLCPKAFRQKGELVVHSSKHIGIQHTCHCGKSFPHIVNLKKHQRNVHSANKKYKCEICFKRFAYKTPLMVHIRSHSGSKRHSCSKCGQCFAAKAALSSHQLSDCVKKFKCEVCSVSFLQRAQLRKHSRTHTKKKLSCTSCGKSFESVVAYKAHTRCHGEEKEYSCVSCAKSFHTVFQLKVHLRSHEREEPKCPMCQLKFSNSSDLMKHIRTHIGL